ncbi:RNA polymerase sigma-70 factor [Streptomyces sp. AV19]|uniref:RNA polymerase sigma-70 factor n=1 Tax=Streptomyces sp. AV19 TaxID=2793068 RepID=UPI0018FEF245|nr:RNA polymerase sigma-70 factor [Streptomyces sp. AV19]MBH1938714.1 RNA polymerase sigma-70 factor [Streptomyces sp. AV19]MDG4533975.1 RNA polymerase sigma-70 factor [Streptomyces sp. AV19]
MTDEFEALRPMLLGLAYRMLGSMWDAEDVVQEAYVRWLRTDRAEVREPRAFLATVVSRLALNQLRSARVTRESYPGSWLPEPVATDTAGPLDTAELRDTLSYATLHLMERLTPPERAVFVLRDAFEMPYEQIAEVVGASAATCRQTHRRALGHLAAARKRGRPSREEHERLLTRFLDAAAGGDLAALKDLLSADVTAWSDGGGKVRAALRPIVGFDKVAAFVLGLTRRHEISWTRIVDANGRPAVRLASGDREQLVLADIHDGRIHALYTVLSPDKLQRVG